jgi:hypothetical protein
LLCKLRGKPDNQATVIIESTIAVAEAMDRLQRLVANARDSTGDFPVLTGVVTESQIQLMQVCGNQ